MSLASVAALLQRRAAAAPTLPLMVGRFSAVLGQHTILAVNLNHRTAQTPLPSEPVVDAPPVLNGGVDVDRFVANEIALTSVRSVTRPRSVSAVEFENAALRRQLEDSFSTVASLRAQIDTLSRENSLLKSSLSHYAQKSVDLQSELSQATSSRHFDSSTPRHFSATPRLQNPPPPSPRQIDPSASMDAAGRLYAPLTSSATSSRLFDSSSGTTNPQRFDTSTSSTTISRPFDPNAARSTSAVADERGGFATPRTVARSGSDDRGGLNLNLSQGSNLGRSGVDYSGFSLLTGGVVEFSC
jgi:hypothetical protein